MSAPIPALTIRAIHASGVEVPMTYALGTSRARVTSAPLLQVYHDCASRGDRQLLARDLEDECAEGV